MLELLAEPITLLACASAAFFLAASVAIKKMCPPKLAESRRFVAIAWAVGFPPAMIVYSAALLVGAKVAAPCNGKAFTASVLALWLMPALPLASWAVGAIIGSTRAGCAHFVASMGIAGLMCWEFDHYSNGIIEPAFAMTIAWTSLTLISFLLWVLFGARLQLGVCARCDYDLRGLRGAKCPECGTEITTGSPRYDFPSVVAAVTRSPPEFMQLLLRQERLLRLCAMIAAVTCFAIAPAIGAKMLHAQNSLAGALLQVVCHHAAFGASLFFTTRFSDRSLQFRAWVWIAIAANALGFVMWTMPLTALNWFGPCNVPGGYMPNARSLDLFGPVWPFLAWLGPMTLVAGSIAARVLRSKVAAGACVIATMVSTAIIYVYAGENFMPLAVYPVAAWHLLTSFACGVLGVHAAYRHRIARGLCVRCSYDLRGLACDRCPECGTPIGADQGRAGANGPPPPSP